MIQEVEGFDETTPTERPTDPSPTTSTNHVPGRFVMKIREVYSIPQSTVNNLLEDVTGLCTSSLDKVKDDLLHKTDTMENSEHIHLLILQSFDNASLPFEGLQTEYKQTSYYKEYFNYMVIMYNK